MIEPSRGFQAYRFVGECPGTGVISCGRVYGAIAATLLSSQGVLSSAP
jgi:hypothetical protein